MSNLENMKEALYEKLPQSKWKEHKSYSSSEIIEIILSNGNSRIFLQYKYGLYMTRFLVVGKDGRGKALYKEDDFDSIEEAIDDLVNYMINRFPNKL